MSRKRADSPRWRAITADTYVRVEDGRPVRARSRRRDLDRAFDDVCQEFGRTLKCGSWEAAEDQEGATPEHGEDAVWWEIGIDPEDDLDAFIAERTEKSPGFSGLLADAEKRRRSKKRKD